jgi:hypothetical protein
LSTSCVVFSYPKLLSISVLTFIKWRLTLSYVAKDTIFLQKRPNQALPWVRSIQRQRSNWSPTYILHVFHLEDTSLLFLFISARYTALVLIWLVNKHLWQTYWCSC